MILQVKLNGKFQSRSSHLTKLPNAKRKGHGMEKLNGPEQCLEKKKEKKNGPKQVIKNYFGTVLWFFKTNESRSSGDNCLVALFFSLFVPNLRVDNWLVHVSRGNKCSPVHALPSCFGPKVNHTGTRRPIAWHTLPKWHEFESFCFPRDKKLFLLVKFIQEKRNKNRWKKKKEKAKPMARLILVIKLILGKWNLLWLQISPTFLIQNKVPLIFYDLCYFDESWTATYLTKFHPSH